MIDVELDPKLLIKSKTPSPFTNHGHPAEINCVIHLTKVTDNT